MTLCAVDADGDDDMDAELRKAMNLSMGIGAEAPAMMWVLLSYTGDDVRKFCHFTVGIFSFFYMGEVISKTCRSLHSMRNMEAMCTFWKSPHIYNVSF